MLRDTLANILLKNNLTILKTCPLGRPVPLRIHKMSLWSLLYFASLFFFLPIGFDSNQSGQEYFHYARHGKVLHGREQSSSSFCASKVLLPLLLLLLLTAHSKGHTWMRKGSRPRRPLTSTALTEPSWKSSGTNM